MWEEEPARVAWRHYQDWVLPLRVVRVILILALFSVFVGMVLVSVGGGLHYQPLIVAGVVLAGLGGCGLLVCLCLCLHAYFIFRVRDQAVQTEDLPWSDERDTTQPNASHSLTLSLPLPSALKSSESSTLRRQTGDAKKSVTYSGEVQCYSPQSSPSLSATSLLSSVFSSTAGTLDRGVRGGGTAGVLERGDGGLGERAGGSGTQPFPPSFQYHSLPHNLRLQLNEDNDYDVPVERTFMLPPSHHPYLPQQVSDGGSVKSAGAEATIAPSSLQLPRRGPVNLGIESSSKTSDYDNI